MGPFWGSKMAPKMDQKMDVLKSEKVENFPNRVFSGLDFSILDLASYYLVKPPWRTCPRGVFGDPEKWTKMAKKGSKNMKIARFFEKSRHF